MEQCSSFSLPEISMNELALKLIESLPYVSPILIWSPLCAKTSKRCYNNCTPMKKKQNERKKTGLNDRKGKEIREGDVVIMEGWKGLLGIVEYQEPHFWVSVHNEKYGAADLIWINWHEEVEVIGNIYDQPEPISKAATSKYIYEDNFK